MRKTAKIFIAGHQGLAGSAIKRKLEEQGFTNLITMPHKALDLTDQKAVKSFFNEERPEFVFLAAAKVGGIVANNTYPADFIYQNLMIQTNVIHQSYLHGVERLLFLGSSCIYPKDCPQPIKEEYLLSGYLEPTNEPYAIAKIAGIKQCEAYNRQYGTCFISAMPTNLYGPGDNFDLTSSHVLPAMIRKFHLGKLAQQQQWKAIEMDEQRFGPIPMDIKASLGLGPKSTQSMSESRSSVKIVLWGSGSPRREFLHVDDLAEVCIKLMRQPIKPDFGKCISWINIGTGKDTSIKSLAELVAKIVGYEGDIIWDTNIPDGTKRKVLDTTAINTTGWTPTVHFAEGIESTYDWYKKQKCLNC